MDEEQTEMDIRDYLIVSDIEEGLLPYLKGESPLPVEESSWE